MFGVPVAPFDRLLAFLPPTKLRVCSFLNIKVLSGLRQWQSDMPIVKEADVQKTSVLRTPNQEVRSPCSWDFQKVISGGFFGHLL